MRRGSTGHYKITSVGGEQIQAFIPHPLPPDPNIFLYAYVRREAVLSSQIEGTQSSLTDLLLFELEEAPGVPFDDVVEVSGYVAALEHGMARLRDGFPLSNRLMREMHQVLLAR